VLQLFKGETNMVNRENLIILSRDGLE